MFLYVYFGIHVPYKSHHFHLGGNTLNKCVQLSANASSTGDCESKLYGCVCTCCHAKKLCCDCVIFLHQNYDFDNPVITAALSSHYREIRNKEFICKKCHEQLRRGIYMSQPCKKGEPQAAHALHSHFTQADLTSMDVALNPAWTNHCLCTCCHKTDLPRSKCIIFKESWYNFTNTTVIEALSTRFSVPTSQEFICKQCDAALIAEKMPIYAVTAHTRPTTTNQQKCVSCGTVCVDKIHHFDSTTYGKNSLATTIAENQMSQKDNIICNKCHNTISKESIVTCLNCRNTVPKKSTYIFNKKKYSPPVCTTEQPDSSKTARQYICKKCHMNLVPKVTCVCCKMNADKHICKIYNKLDYDFTKFIVSRCLEYATNTTDEEKYICASCNKRLIETSNDNPVLPYYGEHLCVKAGANFLKALQEKPEFVCTCCHHILFHKTVKPFKLTDFDMGNDIVQKCLSHRYVMKVHKHKKHPSNNEQTSHEWPTIHSANQDAEVVYMDEFICTCCCNSLQQKKNKNA